MAKKLHPADVYVAEQIARCVMFNVHFRKSSSETFNVPANSLDEAKAAAVKLNEEHGQNGRRSGIYGITPEGAAFAIGETYQTNRHRAA